MKSNQSFRSDLMDIYCTRPHCEQPLNSFADLDSSKFLKPVHQKHCSHCGMPLILDGRYLPLKLLHQDELSATFLGCDLHSPKLKLCKIDQILLDPNFSPSQVKIATKIFHREAEVLEKLGEHPKIPRLFVSAGLELPASATSSAKKFFYLVHEQIEGQNLAAELLSKGKFTESEVIFVLREVAKILEFVHFQGAIHLNLKPANILRDLYGKIYLINFGAIDRIIAETKYTSDQLSKRNSNSGFILTHTALTPPLSQEVDPASDLYSLAVTCLNLLTNKHPKDLLDIETNQWKWRTPDLQVSDAFAAILDRMLQSNLTKRFASARDVLDTLEEHWGTSIISIPTSSIISTSIPTSSPLMLEITGEDPFPFDDDFSQLEDSFLELDRDLFQLDDRLFEDDQDSGSLALIPAPSKTIPRPIAKSQKPWLIGGLLTAGIGGLVAMVISKLLLSPSPTPIATDLISRRSSSGERILLSFEGNRDTEKFKELKRAGVLAIATKNYPEAVTKLQLALAENPNAPETRIYLNNALIGNNKSYTIATAAPISRSLDRASEMLRGFAQAQSEINQIGGVNEAKIKLEIIDDSDDPKIIDGIANAIVKQPEVLGIVGHNRNDVTIKAAQIYDRSKLAFIAPISTVNSLTDPNKPYIFRTNIKSNLIAKQLVDRLIDKERRQKIAIFYVPNVAANDEFKNQFTEKLIARGGKVVCAFPFATAARNGSSATIFNPEDALRQANKMGAEAILILPVGRSHRDALKLLEIRAAKYPQLSIYGDMALYSLNTLKAGRTAQGLVLSLPWQQSESTPQFTTGASQLWNTQVNWATATSYNAVKALGTAIKAQEPPSRAGVMKLLSEGDFMGASGRFQFTKGEPNTRHILVQISKTPPSYKYSSRTGYDFVPID